MRISSDVVSISSSRGRDCGGRDVRHVRATRPRRPQPPAVRAKVELRIEEARYHDRALNGTSHDTCGARPSAAHADRDHCAATRAR